MCKVIGDFIIRSIFLLNGHVSFFGCVFFWISKMSAVEMWNVLWKKKCISLWEGKHFYYHQHITWKRFQNSNIAVYYHNFWDSLLSSIICYTMTDWVLWLGTLIFFSIKHLNHFLSYIKQINISELGSMQTAYFTSQYQLLLFSVNDTLIMLTLWPRFPHLVWQASWRWGPVR